MGGAGAVPHSITRGQNGAGPLFDDVAALGAGGTGYGVGTSPCLHNGGTSRWIASLYVLSAIAPLVTTTGDSSACADRRNYPSRLAASWTAAGGTATPGTRRSSSAEPTRLECTTTTSTTLDVSPFT